MHSNQSDTITQKDRRVLRELAKRQLEIASSQQMKSRVQEWYAHNDCSGEVPLIVIETETFPNEIPLEESRCESDFAKSVEAELLKTLANHEHVPDDKVVPDVFCINVPTWFKPFGLEVKRHDLLGSIGHQFLHQIGDLENDFELLGKSTYGSLGMEWVLHRQSTITEIFGDILPVEITGQGLYSVPTQDIVHIMGLENMMVNMMDYPVLFFTMMEKLTDDYIEYFRWLEAGRLLQPTASHGGVGNGTFAYTKELPTRAPVSIGQVWGFMDSQETVGISPASYAEQIFPHYRKIADMYGLMSYGCCEPVDAIYDSCLSKLDKLRKLSVSAWCNEEFIGERLKGKKTIFHRKPSPNYLGLGADLDEDGWRKHITRTLKAARGCKLEITQRDVYTVNNDFGKVARFIQIAREAIVEHW